MSRSRFSEQYEFIKELKLMMKKHSDIGQNESFDYPTVVECIRFSDVGAFFDFERYDNDISKGHKPTLNSKPFRWKDNYKNVFLDAYLEVDYFIRRNGNIDAHFVPFIHFHMATFQSLSFWYKTIPQLIAGLADIIELISRKSQEFILEEEEVNAKKRRKLEVLESIPDIIKAVMKKDKIMYDVADNDDDTITVSFRMPKRTKLSVKMKVQQVPNNLHYIVNMILPAVSTYESAHRFTISGYGNNARWKEVEKYKDIKSKDI